MVSIPAEARSHHTVWVQPPSGRAIAIRYAVDGDSLCACGDRGLGNVAAGTRVEAAIRRSTTVPLGALRPRRSVAPTPRRRARPSRTAWD